MPEKKYELGSFCHFPKREDDENIIEVRNEKTLPEEE